MSGNPKTGAIEATAIAARPKGSSYPPPFAARVAGRTRRHLGDAFGLANFGVNLTELAPGAESALLHRHSKQDEFVYILDGNPTLETDDGAEVLAPGMCVGFPAGGIAHHLVNRTDAPVRYLEIGDRTPGDEGHYPDDDLVASMEDGRYVFRHKDGRPYE